MFNSNTYRRVKLPDAVAEGAHFEAPRFSREGLATTYQPYAGGSWAFTARKAGALFEREQGEG